MNVTIRPLQEQDAYTSVKWRNDPEVFKYTGNTYKNEILLETELAWIKKVMHNENEYRCAILVEETYVGNIYLTDIAEGKANYHIFIGNKDFWGKGIAKKASELIIKYAFETLQLNEIHLRVKKLNDRALNLYKSLGFSIDSEEDEWISMSKYRVMVSIRCLVYNHEPYLRQCLDGFVMQKANFKFEAIVHDDASTDGSAAIIREYAEKYPDIIKPIFETENQYSKHDGSLFKIIACACRGKYIANCEGDDFWTDPCKLEKQVSFMEAHPSLIATTHNSFIVGKNGEIKKKIYPSIKNGFYSLKNFRKDILPGQLSSLIFKKNAKCFNLLEEYAKKKWVSGPGDRRYYLLLAAYGEIYCLNEKMSAYRFVTDCGYSFSATNHFHYEKNITYYSNLKENVHQLKAPNEALFTVDFLYIRALFIALIHAQYKLINPISVIKEIKNVHNRTRIIYELFKYYLHRILI